MAADVKPSQKLGAYLGRRPVVLVLLFVAAIIFFLVVSALSRAFHAQQATLADRWFNRGVTDLKARRYQTAVLDFRSALRYARDDYSYQLDLAQALMGQGKTSEAHAYLVNLWDRQPENGFVNLELARIAAQQGETDKALRYYHNAIYATWPDDQEGSRRFTRLELIEYLLKINAKAQAQAELIALEANIGNNAELQTQLGDLFVRTQDYEHGLAAYRLSLKSDPHNHAALAGAGSAAFNLGQYSVAEKYLREAIGADPQDAASAAQLKTAEDVLSMDPARRGASASQRARTVMEDFEVAGSRLKFCVGSSAPAQTSSLQSLADSWEKMKSRLDESALRRDPDLVEEAMGLVFSIERQTNTACGSPTGADKALLLIARLHEGS